MNDKPKSKWYWRALRWGLIGLAVLATLAAILITEENWRGKRDWEAYKHAAEARGERLDTASVIPPVVADDQNFFSAPIVAEALQAARNLAPGAITSTNPAVVNRMNFDIYRGHIAEEIKQGGSWQKATLTDLKQWQTAFRNFSTSSEGHTNRFPATAQPQTPAADVLLALSVFDPGLEELRQASLRPAARIPLNYEDDFQATGELLPWLANLKRCAQFLQLRILAELQDNQDDHAVADIKLLLRLTDSIREEPYLISHLVRMAMMAITVQPIYEGLAQRRWSDAQLAELETALAKEDFLADYQYVMNGEKIFTIDTLEKQRLAREMKFVDESHGTNRIATVNLRMMPSAYFYQNELAFAQLNDELTSTVMDVTNRIISPAVYNRKLAEIQARAKHYSPYKIQALLTAPAIAAVIKKSVRAQSDVDLACVACALERYRLAHGEYPASLDALAPKFIETLPHDIINGHPLHYRVTNDGKFMLYSVGWNENDDGGNVVLTKGGTVDVNEGDWVWKY